MNIISFQRLSFRERVLGGVFAAFVLVVGAGLVWDALQVRHADAVRRRQALRSQIAEAQRWLAEKPLWEARARWLMEVMKPSLSANEASSRFLDQLQKSAAQQNLQISQQGLLDHESSPGLLGVAAKLVFQGSLKETTCWLAELQQPGEFVELVVLELRPLPQSGRVECSVQLHKWFAQGSPGQAALAGGGVP